MDDIKHTLAVRSVSAISHDRLAQLRVYTRLTCGSLIDDAIDALWQEYLAEGHNILENSWVYFLCLEAGDGHEVDRLLSPGVNTTKMKEWTFAALCGECPLRAQFYRHSALQPKSAFGK